MSDDDAAWRSGTGGARMSGSGARDGFGSPPWDPADPVPHPDLDDTQALPGLGSIPEPVGSGSGPGGGGPGGPGGDPRFGAGSLFGGVPQGAARADETRVDLTAADDGTDTADGTDEADGGQQGKEGKRRRSFLRELPILVV